ncbi:substrate-binding domain-containing protein, partial [Acinetobacter baumannii]
ITVTGSSTLAPVLLEMAKAYEAKTPNVRVDVQTGGSSKGLADARSGKADIGMVSRARRPDETDLQWTLVANDGLAIIVHKSNPLDALSADQV